MRLAVPAFLALVAEPLFLMADSAIIGHLGTQQLAGLGAASAALLTAVGVFVFLAYATTATSARRLGAGDRAGAIASGIDGLWLSVIIGVGAAVLMGVFAGPLVGLFGASEATTTYAVEYLQIACFGIPPMLASLAVTGVLRGLQDTKTPLIASVAAFSLNVVLNVALVYGLHLGIAGSAIGTVIAQWGMAIALVWVLISQARREQAPLRFHPTGVLTSARSGFPLFVRTVALRITLLLTTWVAARMGDVPLAAYQVSMTIWNFLAFVLDALAIAAQALTGKALGEGQRDEVRRLTGLLQTWGVLFGALLAVLLLATHTVLPLAFTSDATVRAALAAALIVIAIGQPLAGYVFVLDGVLIGAGDGRWLGIAQVVMLIAYLPVVWALHTYAPSDPRAATVWLWVGFTVFMAVRGLLLGLRARTDAWMKI